MFGKSRVWVANVQKKKKKKLMLGCVYLLCECSLSYIIGNHNSSR